jgi:hypothetical protein
MFLTLNQLVTTARTEQATLLAAVASGKAAAGTLAHAAASQIRSLNASVQARPRPTEHRRVPWRMRPR